MSIERKRFEKMDFEPMRKAGFNPIAYSVMICEDTFYFNTKEEAKNAYEYFEGGKNATHEYEGWFYSIDEVESNNEFYRKEINVDYVPEIFYLK